MTESAKRAGCLHPEAFALMLYKSDTTGVVEEIWNSRDGVTPFGIRMQDGSEGRHVNWNKDVWAPYHTPNVGDRVFVNYSLEAAIADRTKYVERYWLGTHTMPPMSEMYPTKELAIRSLAEEDIKSFGLGTTPHLIVVDAWWLADLCSRRLPPNRPFVPQKFA